MSSTTLVISMTARHFWQEAEILFGERLREATKNITGGEIRFKDGRRYRLILHPDSLRGFHDVTVEHWGPQPKWAFDPLTEQLIACARMA